MAEENQDGKITITITDNSVKYESNVPIQDTVFWLEVVKAMALENGFQKNEDA